MTSPAPDPTMQPTERQRVAAELTSRLDAHFTYREHRLFEEGRFREIAQRLKKRVRYQQGLSAVLAVCFATGSVFHVIAYGAGGAWVDLGLGLAMLGLAIGWPAYIIHNGAHMAWTADQVLRLLDADREPA